jgi:hypothetical protein
MTESCLSINMATAISRRPVPCLYSFNTVTAVTRHWMLCLYYSTWLHISVCAKCFVSSHSIQLQPSPDTECCVSIIQHGYIYQYAPSVLSLVIQYSYNRHQTLNDVSLSFDMAAFVHFIHIRNLCSNWTDFHEIAFMIFRKSVEKIQVSLKYKNNDG